MSESDSNQTDNKIRIQMNLPFNPLAPNAPKRPMSMKDRCWTLQEKNNRDGLSFQWKWVLTLLLALPRYGKAMLRFWWSGLPKCHQSTVDARFAECLQCPRYVDDAFASSCGVAGFCTECGCCANNDPKAKRNKLLYPTERCPLPAEDGGPRWVEAMPLPVAEAWVQLMGLPLVPEKPEHPKKEAVRVDLFSTGNPNNLPIKKTLGKNSIEIID